MKSEADLDWYSRVSKEQGVSGRCPYASLSRCPRYFQSAALVKHAGGAALLEEDDKRFRQKWENSEHWIEPPGSETNVSGGKTNMMPSRFCPEISYENFGLFAESLMPYLDPADKEFYLSRFETSSGAVSPNWRFSWADIKPLHYTDCSYYSRLSVSVISEPIQDAKSKASGNVVHMKPGMFGFSLDLRILVTKFCRWWLNKNS